MAKFLPMKLSRNNVSLDRGPGAPCPFLLYFCTSHGQAIDFAEEDIVLRDGEKGSKRNRALMSAWRSGMDHRGLLGGGITFLKPVADCGSLWSGNLTFPKYPHFMGE